MFGHILNFMRTGRPLLPEGFDQFELLLEEARYYELTDFVNILLNLQLKTQAKPHNNGISHVSRDSHVSTSNLSGSWDVLALHVSPEMERILISGMIYELIEELYKTGHQSWTLVVLYKAGHNNILGINVRSDSKKSRVCVRF